MIRPRLQPHLALLLVVPACSGSAGPSLSESAPTELASNQGSEGVDGEPSLPDNSSSEAVGAAENSSDVTRLARLTHAQYDNTVRDLLGIDSGTGRQFAPDALNNFEFDTSVDFRVDSRLGPQYRVAAEQLAERAVNEPTVFERIVPCDPIQSGCESQFVVTFGERAFRRPLTPIQRTRFEELFAKGPEFIGSGDAFRDGMQVVVEAMLQSPQFLYRNELGSEQGSGGRTSLDSWDIASKLSYFLLDSMPDAQLFEQARAGALSSPDLVRSEVERLLEEPSVTRKLTSFHRQAWHFDKFSSITPDPNVYPEVPDDIAQRLQDASLRFVGEVIDAGGGLSEFLTASYAFADSETAPLYGLSASEELTRIELEPSERKGLLMQAGFLASHAYSVKTDPIHRGLFVVRDLLCREIPDPPPGASMAELPQTDEPIETTRQEVSLLTSGAACANCHSQINPPGFAFEGFDAVGRMRSMENGIAVDTSGQMTLDGTTLQFASALDIVEALTQSTEAHECYAAKWLTFAYGRELLPGEQCAVEQLSQVGQSVREMVLNLTTSNEFLTRPGGATQGLGSAAQE